MSVELIFRSESLNEIAERVAAGERLSREDGIRLFESNDLLMVGHLAAIVNARKNGERVYFIQNRHINYTNVCKNRCRFCAFSRSQGQDGAYTMSVAERDQIMRDWPDVWAYEGPVFAAFPEGKQPADAYAVHRFWSNQLGHHFYTIDEAEKQWLMDNYSNIWAYEGIVWYAYAP